MSETTPDHISPWQLGMRMYSVTEELARAWEEFMLEVILALRRRGWTEALQIDRTVDDLSSFWLAPNLLLGQTCGYPLVTSLRDRTHVLGTPEFTFPHCAGANYASLFLAREDSVLQSLQDLRGRRIAVNGMDSHSGMNALRHSVAPLAREGRFFGALQLTGGHRESLQAVQSGAADATCVDCVHYGFALRDAPERVAGLRLLHVTAKAPGLPFIASRHLGAAQLHELRQVLCALPAARPDLAARLAISSIRPTNLADYQAILDMEREAVEAGYPALA